MKSKNHILQENNIKNNSDIVEPIIKNKEGLSGHQEFSSHLFWCVLFALTRLSYCCQKNWPSTQFCFLTAAVCFAIKT